MQSRDPTGYLQGMKKQKLPNKPSALLRVAVADAKKIEQTPGYCLNMGSWHRAAADSFSYEPNDACEVCLAGSVMACTLQANRNRSYDPEDFDQATSDKLRFIDDMRIGQLELLQNSVMFDDDNLKDRIAAVGDFISKHVRGDVDRAPWWIYLKAADRLEALGF